MKLLLASILLGATLAVPLEPKAPACGYEKCPKAQAGKLNVHLVPHTHDDVGWLKTVDQYYYGSRNNIQNAGVQYILDSVVSALLQNPARRFIWVETSFFWKWWVEQTPELQAQVKELVDAGRLEFIGGGWSMNDEAATHYMSTIDNFSYGLRKLNETFGVCGQPKIGWQIDPFGHSREQASLMAQYGFDGLFFARLDYQDKATRVAAKTMEMIWETSPTLGASADIFGHGLFHEYAPPPGFCFDILCNDEPIIDDPTIPDYNVPKRVDDFIAWVQSQGAAYRSNNIILTMGEDFYYQDASHHFKNLDKLIRYVNERQSNVNVFYSTPSCYVKSVNEANLSLPTKKDDFFPYASNAHSYWTGYFTSRPTLKYMERQGQNLLQATKQAATVTKVNSDNLEEMKAAMGIMQHHDAVTGTEKQAVAEDYARLLDKGVRATETVLSNALNTLMKKAANAPALQFDSCRLRNISQCALTAEKDTFLVTVYNPLSRPVDYFVRLPVQNTSYTVRAPGGTVVQSQLLPVPDQVTRIPGRTATTKVELVFTASALPALGYRSYYVSKGSAAPSSYSKVWVPAKDEAVSIGDDTVTINLDEKTKILKSITSRAETYDVAQSLQYYNSWYGDNNGEDNRASGAYVFRPNGNDPKVINAAPTTTVIEGDVVREVHQVFSDWATQIIRYYNNQPVVEFEWLVGPIPVDDNVGKEVISKFTTTIPTNSLFYTDANGREVLQRKKDFRPSWNLQVNEPTAGNYYPVVSHINFANATAGLAIVTDRAQGGSSLSEGSLEVMVHRRCLHDDAFGAGEALNETAYGSGLVARGKHFVLIGDSRNVTSPREIRLLEVRKNLDAIVLISDATGKTQANIETNYVTEYSSLKAALPEQVQILTLEPWSSGTVLLRLENIFSPEEQGSTVTVDLSNLFAKLNVLDAKETNLSANKWITDVTRLQWKKESNEIPVYSPPLGEPIAAGSVTLAPRQIRTFVLTVA